MPLAKSVIRYQNVLYSGVRKGLWARRCHPLDTYKMPMFLVGGSSYSQKCALNQPSRLVCQKYAKRRKAAVKTLVTVLKMRITCKQKCDRNELWITECALFCFQSWNSYFSVAFKWLIVLRSAMKTRDQTHRILKNVFAAYKTHVYASSALVDYPLLPPTRLLKENPICGTCHTLEMFGLLFWNAAVLL